MLRERAFNSTLSKWMLIGLGWAAFALFFASELVARRAYAGFPPNIQRALVIWSICAGLWFAATPLILWLARRFPIDRHRWTEPLGINRYYLMVSPAGDFSITGGARFPTRDFMKLGQLHLNGGSWNGRKLFTPEWSRRATATSVTEIGGRKRQYGYLWWINEYRYKGRTVRAYYAAGNGGQIVMAIPDLDLVIAFYGGNYNDASVFIPQNVYVPQHILPVLN